MKKHVAGFNVIGITARTDNAQEAGPNGAIGQLWQRLFSEGLLNKIPHRTDNAIVALYTDYASDYNGKYTYTLGSRTESCNDVPEGMICRHVEPAEYAVIESDRGALPGIVIQMWQKVWKMTPEELGGVRGYRADWELYDQRAADPKDAQVELYLNIR